MGKYLALAIAMLSSAAAAEFSIVEDTEQATVYRDRDHVIVLVDITSRGKMFFFISEERPGGIPLRGSVRDESLGADFYYVHLRLLDNQLVCEKIATRPTPELRERLVAHLATCPCG